MVERDWTKDDITAEQVGAMRISAWLFALMLLLTMSQGALVEANSNKKFNATAQGCTCHGNTPSITPSLTGLPTAWEPGTTYTLSIGMSGSPSVGGFNLLADSGTLANPSTNAQISGQQATHDGKSSTSWTLDWTAPVAGTGDVEFKLAVLHGNNQGGSSGDQWGKSSTIVPEATASNAPPSITGLVISPASPTSAEDLTATYAYSDEDGDIEQGTTFAWFLDDVLQPAHAQAVLPASATQRGQTWRVEVVPSDGTDTGSGANASVEVLNAAPEPTAFNISDEQPEDADDLSFTLSASDNDGDTFTTHVRWRVHGQPIPELDNATTVPAIATRDGDVWDAQVRFDDGFNMSIWYTTASATVGGANTPPVVAGVSLPAAAFTTQDIDITYTVSDADGDEVTMVETVWMADGVELVEGEGLNPLPGALTSKGQALQAMVRAFDGFAWSPWASSNVVLITNSAPTVTATSLNSPSLSANDDLVLNVTWQDADGDAVVVSSVTYFADGVEQPEHAGADRVVGSALQRGQVWSAVVEITDGEDTATASTPGVTVVNAAPRITVMMPASTTTLTPLSPDITVTDADDDVLSVDIDWYKNGFKDSSLHQSQGVPVAKLEPGQEWRMVVTVSDGETDTVEEKTATVSNLPPVAIITLVSSNIWLAEETVVSASMSNDPDGDAVAYLWTWDGGRASGETLRMIPERALIVSLTVTDARGASNTTELELMPVAGPSVSGLEAVDEGDGRVLLRWSWNGEAVQFNIVRNGDTVATVNATTYIDTPPLSGTLDYVVQPVDEERTYQAGVGGIATQVLPPLVEQPGPSVTLGLLVGVVALLASAVMLQQNLRRGGDA